MEPAELVIVGVNFLTNSNQLLMERMSSPLDTGSARGSSVNPVILKSITKYYTDLKLLSA